MANIQKRPDGKWRARYRDAAKKEHSRHFTRKIDAQKWLDEVTTSKLTGAYVDPRRSKETVGSMAATWLASNPDWTASTRSRNTGIAENYIKPRWENMALRDVTHEDIQEWVGSIDRAGGTVRKIAGVLSSILDLAVISRRLAVNPAASVKLPKQDLKPRQYLSAAQVERMAAAAGQGRDVVLVLAYTGLRFGELAALKVRSVDQLRRRFMIEESVTDVDGELHWGTPKDHQRRSVPYPKFLAEDIAARMKGKKPDDLLFPTNRGAVMRVVNARRDWFDRAAVKAGVKVTPHELRHTAASLAVKAGASVLALQRMLGHDKPSTTLDVYADLFDEDLDDVAERLATVRASGVADYLRTKPELVDGKRLQEAL
ncbi:site-specific integrase [Tessaracoccus sp. MC1865]|uniref:tyrosine-type recombinase/integrase n=1 Tax=Tessaracoccus sp. MC1865 TaxID=2760310 RepID=UPI0016001DC6|nr:site-specific integrase [Tessaracoccus sp. MC1865]MBB1482511.1 site-specific integrase [Tessaracoccus sp. MC1865]QTO38034.1 site-specific integrase [Tessaracoccus sp. MC1865]